MGNLARTDGRPPLLGRADELALLERAVRRLPRGGLKCLQLVGEPGVGKSRLLAELARLADDAGFLVLRGRAAELESEAPYGPVVDALDDYLGTLSSSWLGRLGGARLAELAGVFPSLGGAVDGTPRLQVERFRTHDAVRALLTALAGRSPVVLVLDDVHWADPASLELLAHLLRRGGDAPLLIAVGYRRGQLPEAAEAQLARAAVEGAAERLELAPLGREEAEPLLERIPDRRLRESVFHESGGNPFYLEQLARVTDLAAGGRGPGAALDGVPLAVAGALALELARLDADARVLLQGAAVVGEPFEPELAAVAAETTLDDALRLIDALAAAELIRPTDVPRRFVFRHPLVLRAVHESAGAGWRIAAHRRVADALRAAGAPLTRLAHHVERAAAPGDVESAEVLAQAAHTAAPRAPATAAHWFKAALELLPAGPEAAERRRELLLPMARALGTSGRLDEAHDALAAALDEGRDAAPEARAELVALLARFEHPLGRHGGAAAELERALADLPPGSDARAAVLELEMAVDAFFALDFARMRSVAGTARERAIGVGEPSLQAAAASCMAMASYYMLDLPEALVRVDEATALVDGQPDGAFAGEADTFWWLGWAEQLLERWDASAAHLRRGIDVARATGQEYVYAELQQSLAVPLGWQGRLAEAAEAVEQAIEAATLAGNDHHLMWAELVRCWLATRAGRHDEAVEAGRRAAALADSRPEDFFGGAARCYLGEALVEAGRPAEGIAELQGDSRAALVIQAPASCHWQAVLARGALALGDLDQAEEWVAAAERSAAALDQPARRGWAGWARAALELSRGDAAGAAERALDAASALDTAGDTIGASRARITAARALAQSGERERALTELEAARAELDARGALRYRDEADRELRRLGRRVPRRGERAPSADGLGALSPRELEVATLVAEGRTNREVASTLFVSEKTVETHLGRVFRKLGASSRAEVAARVAAERG